MIATTLVERGTLVLAVADVPAFVETVKAAQEISERKADAALALGADHCAFYVAVAGRAGSGPPPTLGQPLVDRWWRPARCVAAGAQASARAGSAGWDRCG